MFRFILKKIIKKYVRFKYCYYLVLLIFIMGIIKPDKLSMIPPENLIFKISGILSGGGMTDDIF